MDVEELLTRLEKVKKAGAGRWMARCPAHSDKSPSLSIREVDGTILLHDFGGCSVGDICASIGVEMTDLFPPSEKREWVGQEKPVRFGAGLKFSAIDALRCLGHEGSVILLLACDMAEGKVLAPDEIDRVTTAVGRLNAALEYLGENQLG